MGVLQFVPTVRSSSTWAVLVMVAQVPLTQLVSESEVTYTPLGEVNLSR